MKIRKYIQKGERIEKKYWTEKKEFERVECCKNYYESEGFWLEKTGEKSGVFYEVRTDWRNIIILKDGCFVRNLAEKHWFSEEQVWQPWEIFKTKFSLEYFLSDEYEYRKRFGSMWEEMLESDRNAQKSRDEYMRILKKY